MALVYGSRLDRGLLCLVFEEEGTRYKSFSTRNNILGHLQQGNAPSCLDRIRATRLASAGVAFLLDHCIKAAADDIPCSGPDRFKKFTSQEKIFCTDHLLVLLYIAGSVCVSGISGAATKMIPVEDMHHETNFKTRTPKYVPMCFLMCYKVYCALQSPP